MLGSSSKSQTGALVISHAYAYWPFGFCYVTVDSEKRHRLLQLLCLT